MSALASSWILPYRFRSIYRAFRDRSFTVLDVGCGNHSPEITKRWFPKCRYFGIDRHTQGLTARDRAAMDGFFEIDLSCGDLAQVPDNTFDVILMAHVIEHLPNGTEVLQKLTDKVAPAGFFYVEFPSPRSLGLPSAKGTLQFCDDPTHVRVYDVKEIANALLEKGLRVLNGGRRRDPIRILLSPLTLPLQLKTLVGQKRLHATGLWDLLGFADFVVAQKPRSA